MEWDEQGRPRLDERGNKFSRWTPYDRLIEEAHKRNLRVLLTLAAPMPFWASEDPQHCIRDKKERAAWSCGWQPNPREYARFVTAVGRHFLGKEIWGVTLWNEPNIGSFLADATPQRLAMRYRKMWFVGRKALRKTAGIRTRVFFGDMANDLISPGDDLPGCQKSCDVDAPSPGASCQDCGHTDTNQRSKRWKVFRQALCLDSAAPESGDDLAPCHSAPRRVWSSGVAFHPYSPQPLVVKHSVEVLARFMDEAVRERRLSCNQGIYLTEHSFLTQRGDRGLGAAQAVNLSEQASYNNITDHYLYENPRVKTSAQYELYDDGRGYWESGLKYSNTNQYPEYLKHIAELNPKDCLSNPKDSQNDQNLQQCGLKLIGGGNPKPAYEAYRLSIDVVRTTQSNQVEIFALARSIAPSPRVFVEQKRSADPTWMPAGTLEVDELGYGKKTLPYEYNMKFRLVFPSRPSSDPCSHEKLCSREVSSPR